MFELYDHLLGACAIPAIPVADLRWFTPTPKFWETLKRFQKDYGVMSFVDVGTGRGDLPREAADQGIKMLGLDLMPSPFNPEVKQGMGENWPTYGPLVWPMVCRPCHSGFPAFVRQKALSNKAFFIYVGFRKNLSRDVGSMSYSFVAQKVGIENESLYLFTR